MNMNIALAYRNSLVDYDGVFRRSNRKAYIGESIMVVVSSEGIAWTNHIPCRIAALVGVNYLAFLTQLHMSALMVPTVTILLWEQVGAGTPRFRRDTYYRGGIPRRAQ